MHKINWKIHLKSSPQKVYEFLSTDSGREKFWAESCIEENGYVHFKFINGQEYIAKILVNSPSFFELEYCNSIVKFEMLPADMGGTDLILNNYGVSDEDYLDNYAGWLSVLFALKGAVDFGIDFRNHDPQRTWDNHFVEN